MALPKIDKQLPEISITEEYLPKYRKISSLKPAETQKTIPQYYDSVMQNIESLDQFFGSRLAVHEQQLLKIVKQETKRILDDLRKIINVYNKMIHEKNLSQDLWEIRNEVDYFKFESVRLFQENVSLKKQIEVLNKEVELVKFEKNCQDAALRNVSFKLAKEKSKQKKSSRRYKSVIINNREELEKNEVNSTRLNSKCYDNSINKIGQKLSNQLSIKTEPKECIGYNSGDKFSDLNIDKKESFCLIRSRNEKVKIMKDKLLAFKKRNLIGEDRIRKIDNYE